MFDQIKLANHALEIPLTRHGQERFSHRVKRLSYMRILMGCGGVDQRGRIRVSAQDLNSLAAEARSEGDYDAAKQLEKIRNLVAVCGRRGALITTYRDDGRYRDPLEQRRCRQRAKAGWRRRVGR
jgi:hypothetical protein